MRRSLVPILMLIASISLFNIPMVSAQGRIVVPRDYPTIQRAVNAVGPGDIIEVRAGAYYENVVISKPISLIGEGPDKTVIYGRGSGPVLKITSDRVIIKGFTVMNGSIGIYLNGARRCEISENVIESNHGYDGIYLSHSSDNKISRNRVEGNSPFGIYLGDSSYNEISENVIKGNRKVGIYLSHSSNNMIFHNNFLGNYRHVIIKYFLYNSWDNGYPSGGNYWSGYRDEDEHSGPKQDQPGSDGICDRPYKIDGNNVDRYPLTKPYSVESFLTEELVLIAGVAGAIILILAFLKLRSRRAREEGTKLVAGGEGKTEVVEETRLAGKVASSELDLLEKIERQVYLIERLEEVYSEGKITEEAYRKLREEYLEKLRDILEELKKRKGKERRRGW